MKKKTILYLIAIMILSTLVIIVCSILDCSLNKYRGLNNKYNELGEKVDKLSNELRAYWFSELDTLNTDIKIVNSYGDTLVLSDLISHSPKVVYRFTELDCIDCVIKEIDDIKKLSSKIGRGNIVILTTYDQVRKLVAFKRTNHIEIEIYNIDKHALNLVAEEINTPYIFVISKNMVVENLYIPNDLFSEISQYYYSSLIMKYSDYWLNKQ